MDDWRSLTPAELLGQYVVLTVAQVARVLALDIGRKDGGRSAGRQLIRDGKLQLVDPDQPVTRWTVSCAEVRRYIAEGPAKAPDRRAL